MWGVEKAGGDKDRNFAVRQSLKNKYDARNRVVFLSGRQGLMGHGD